MRFLDGLQAQDELQRLIDKSKTVNIAVAFWGEPAPELLGLLANKNSPDIVCNLKLGGTNPEAIKALLAAGVKVRQSDRLHGKVYLFDNEAIVGSSNASANGLSLQGRELRGWDEANILVTEPTALQDISRWLETLPKTEIRPFDLRVAEELWSRRRKAGDVNAKPLSKGTLIDDLRERPAHFRGKRNYVCFYSEELSPAGKKSLKFAKVNAAQPDEIDGFENWDALPNFADMICFWREPNKKFFHDGLYHLPEVEQTITKYGTRFQVCHEIKRIAGYAPSRLGSVSDWRASLEMFANDVDDPLGGIIDLGMFSEKYLQAK